MSEPINTESISNEPSEADERLIFLHGFDRADVFKIMTAIKAVLEDPAGIAFSMSTPTNLEWVIKDLIQEVREEHEYLRNNPPPINRNQ